ncbi:hypothetical protein HOLleu_05557 [Holothuria leucospilota]|uniref:Uncharacterized protein n=1 Tax=Holothuria leucospilota TaxID=206669 RepID=A0A9Q1HJ15_HOLLE|nr:hypothetical protein HOLleu_05557 [Holothuria leucospilota]
MKSLRDTLTIIYVELRRLMRMCEYVRFESDPERSKPCTYSVCVPQCSYDTHIVDGYGYACEFLAYTEKAEAVEHFELGDRVENCLVPSL